METVFLNDFMSIILDWIGLREFENPHTSIDPFVELDCLNRRLFVDSSKFQMEGS